VAGAASSSAFGNGLLYGVKAPSRRDLGGAIEGKERSMGRKRCQTVVIRS